MLQRIFLPFSLSGVSSPFLPGNLYEACFPV